MSVNQKTNKLLWERHKRCMWIYIEEGKTPRCVETTSSLHFAS